MTEQEIRQKRNQLLAETDWMALKDTIMTVDWLQYRQALRDITNQDGYPDDIIWPTKPQSTPSTNEEPIENVQHPE